MPEEPRPEMISDRLGYPPDVGDEDWARIKREKQEAAKNTAYVLADMVYVLKGPPTLKFAIALGAATEALDASIRSLHDALAVTPLPQEASDAIMKAANAVVHLLNIHNTVQEQILKDAE